TVRLRSSSRSPNGSPVSSLTIFSTPGSSRIRARPGPRWGTAAATGESLWWRALRRRCDRFWLRWQCRRPALGREGLLRRSARGGPPVRRRGFPPHLVAAPPVPLGTPPWLLRHPAARPVAGARRRGRGVRAVRRRRGRRQPGLRQHLVRAARAVLQRSTVAGHHRLAGRARALL